MIDRAPCIFPAGSSTKNFGRVGDCLKYVSNAEIVNVLTPKQKTLPVYNDGRKVKQLMSRGLHGEIKYNLMPDPNTAFQDLEEELKDTVYRSYWKTPVGKSSDKTPYLPKGFNPVCATFGTPTAASGTAGELLNPKKTAGEIIYEDKLNHNLYVFSHGDYYPGERIEKNYKPPFKPDQMNGMKLNYDPSGRNMKNCLKWSDDDSNHIVLSKIQADFIKRTNPEIGKSRSLPSETKTDVTFGKQTNRGFYSVPELLNDCPASLTRRDTAKFVASVQKLRLNVQKKIKSNNLYLCELLATFKCCDKHGTKSLHLTELLNICKQYDINIDEENVLPFLVMLNIMDEEQRVKYFLFLQLIDMNVPMNIKSTMYVNPPEYQQQNKTLSYSTLYCPCERAAGIPSIRLDLKYPHSPAGMFSAAAECLFGEINARTLFAPSIFTQYNLTHRDFFQPRDKEFIGCLFAKCGMNIDQTEFDELYEEAKLFDNTGGVSVNTFKILLDKKSGYC